MKKYDKYKSSGIDWIREVPEHWEVKKISWLFSIGSGTTPKAGDANYYTDENGINWLQTGDLNNGDIIETSKMVTLRAVYDYKLRTYPKGSLVIAMYGATIGKVGRLNIDTTVNQACCVLYNSKQCNISYAFYMFMAAKTSLLLESYGGGQPNISQDIISTKKILVPSYTEQTAIASYLDSKCSKIDNVITIQQKRIELLKELKQSIITKVVTRGLNKNVKMKDSGIEWIGEVPEHWQVIPTLYALSMPLTDGPHESPKLYEEGVPFISAEAVSGGEIDFESMRGYISEDYYNECCKKYIPQLDDIYMIKSGATTGRTAIVKTEDKFTIWSPLAVFRADTNKILPFYLLYVLRSHFYQIQVENSWSYGTQQNIGMRVLEKIKFPMPPIEEQEMILKYLDSKCSSIDNQISKMERQIELLKEYKQSVITDVVTGKHKVC